MLKSARRSASKPPRCKCNVACVVWVASIWLPCHSLLWSADSLDGNGSRLHSCLGLRRRATSRQALPWSTADGQGWWPPRSPHRPSAPGATWALVRSAQMHPDAPCVQHQSRPVASQTLAFDAISVDLRRDHHACNGVRVTVQRKWLPYNHRRPSVQEELDVRCRNASGNPQSPPLSDGGTAPRARARAAAHHPLSWQSCVMVGVPVAHFGSDTSFSAAHSHSSDVCNPGCRTPLAVEWAHSRSSLHDNP